MFIHSAILPVLALAAVSASIWSFAAFAQTSDISEQLTLDKLELEIAKLEAETSILAHPVILPVVILILGVAGNILLVLLNLRAAKASDAEKKEREKLTAMVEPRLTAYAAAFTHLKPTALFFPPAGRPESKRSPESKVLTREDCRNMGRALSDWYFGSGGVLMTEKSRNAYFALMNALGDAADAEKELISQTVAEHGSAMPPHVIKDYLRELGKNVQIPEQTSPRGSKSDQKKLDDLAKALGNSKFGEPGKAKGKAWESKDFILIQSLASRLRTALAMDIGSREPPGASDSTSA